MNPFSVTLYRLDIGKRQCCLKAANAEAARLHVMRGVKGGMTVRAVQT